MALVGVGIGLLLVVFSGMVGEHLENGATLSVLLGFLLAATSGYCAYLRGLVGSFEKALGCLCSEVADPGANERRCPGCDEPVNPVSGKGTKPIEGQFGRFACTACDTAFSAW